MAKSRRSDRDPKVQIGRLWHLDDDSEKFVQQNHPDVAWLYFDKNQDGKIDGGFGTRPFTHAMELNRDFQDYLSRFGELQKLGAKILAEVSKGERKPGAAS